MAEQTSLARQLKKLAAPQTNLLLQSKIRASLLFDPKEAASLDRDTVFAYGSTGFDKLLMINDAFNDFSDVLFSESSKTFERSVQDKATNRYLDEKLNDFLSMLSPYVLLRAAHEALEWLIYRYHIHMFNTDALVACVLPHYHTRIFVRVIQLLDLSRETDRWYWISHVQKSGKPLELSVLLKQFNSNSGFRKFVCDLAPNIFKLYSDAPTTGQIVISFSTVVPYYAVNQLSAVDESYFMFLLPYLVSGLKSKHPSYTDGACLIISALLVKMKFSEALLTKLCFQILENMVPESTKVALEMLTLIFQRQDIKVIPTKIVSEIFSNPSIASQFQHIVTEYGDTSFVMLVILKAISNIFQGVAAKGKSAKVTLLSDVLSVSMLGKKKLQRCLNAILTSYVKCRSETGKKGGKKTITLVKTGKTLLKSLEICGSENFDNAINAYFNSQKRSKQEKHQALKLINETVGCLRHHVTDSGLTLFLSLNHPVSTVRQNAVKVLLKQLKSKKANDIEFAEVALLERLCDDDIDTVLQVLSLGEKLFDILSREKLLPALFSALQKNVWKNVPKRRKVISAILKIICSQPLPNIVDNMDHFTQILSFLLPLIPEDLTFSSLILNSPVADSHPFFAVFQTDCLPSLKSVTSVTEWNILVLKSLEKGVKSLDNEFCDATLKHLFHHLDVSTCDGRILLFTLFFAQNIFSSKECRSEKMKFLISFRQYLEVILNSDRLSNPDYPADADFDRVFSTCILHLKKKLLPLPMVCYILHSIINNLDEVSARRYSWYQSGDDTLTALADLFYFLLKYCNVDAYSASFKQLLGIFVRQFFPNHQDFLWFLSYFWCKSKELNHNFQLAVLKIASAVCRKDCSLGWFLEEKTVMIPSFIVALNNNDDVLRSSYLQFLVEHLLPSTENCSSPFRIFLETIVSHAEEIISDQNYLKQLVENWLIPVMNDSAMSTPDTIAQEKVFEGLLQLACDLSVPDSVRHVLLHLLQKANYLSLLTRFLPVLKHYLERYEKSTFPLNTEEASIINMLLQRFSPISAGKLKENSEELNVYLACLKVCVQYDGIRDTTVQELVLQTLSKKLFSALPSTTEQRLLFNVLLDMYTNAECVKINTIIEKTLGRISAYSYLLLRDLPAEGIAIKTNDASLKDIKKSRKQISGSSSVRDEEAWKKVTILLEITQSKKNLLEKELLLSELFRLLNLTLDWGSNLSGEYVRQLILANIYNCCSQFELNEIPEPKLFLVELIIQCIRSSQNPKTHHQALLTLNLAATLFPDHVLNNIMSIFTFMGTNLVRQDDSYSFQIIYQTIETIVPALLQASNQADSADTVPLMASIIRLFVNSIPDIPQHRQFPLFSKLITTLGPSDYLWILIGQFSERHLSKSLSNDVADDEQLLSIRELCASLHEQFPLDVQLHSCLNILKHLQSLPLVLDKSTSANRSKKFEEPFDISTHTEDQLQGYKKELLHYMSRWLSSVAFLTLACESENQHATDIETSYRTVLEETLTYLQIITDGEKYLKSWQSHLMLVYELLQNVNALLPPKLFTRVIKKLLSSSIFDIRLKAVEMLSAKLEQQPKFFLQDESNGLLKLLRPLVKIFDDDATFPSEKHEELIQQATLYSLHLICKVHGKDYAMKFFKILPIAVNIICNSKERSRLTVNALLCFAELCRSLNALILPHLNVFMPELLSLMNNFKEFSDNEYLMLATVIVVRELVVHLGGFLNMYMDSILTSLCILIVNYEGNSKKALQENLSSVCDAISTEIDLRVLLPATEKCYKKLLIENGSAVKPLVEIINTKILKIDSSDLILSVSSLQIFFLNLLSFRSEMQTELPFVDSVEGTIIASTLSLVMKMSEPMFQTFFSQIYSWAVPVDGETSESKYKIFTFYRLTSDLAKNLKTLFVAFAKKFLLHCVKILDSCNVSKSTMPCLPSTENSAKLLNNVLNTLSFCFQNDDGHLSEKEYFDLLMQPLVDQIENSLGGDESFQMRIENYLSDCLAHFIGLFSDNSLWKSMNYQLLLKTRHCSPKVRFAALQVIRKVVRQMAENYLVLLPESIPFLAEIMEDESFEVEQECQDVIIEMEKILGEPIKKYF